MSLDLNPTLLSNLLDKVAIVTGGANGIGAEVVRQYFEHGAKVVIADLPGARSSAETAIQRLGDKSRVVFVSVNIVVFDEVCELFQTSIETFGKVDIVVANAGIMETRRFFDFKVDEAGRLADNGAGRIVDVNLKGTMNSE